MLLLATIPKKIVIVGDHSSPFKSYLHVTIKHRLGLVVAICMTNQCAHFFKVIGYDPLKNRYKSAVIEAVCLKKSEW